MDSNTHAAENKGTAPEETAATAPELSTPPAPSKPEPVQIISINDDGERFRLHEDKLEQILGRVPDKMKVSVVSVVGAFRTGKSFLLDFFLRYLRATSDGVEDGSARASSVASSGGGGGDDGGGDEDDAKDKKAGGGDVLRTGGGEAAEGLDWMIREGDKLEGNSNSRLVRNDATGAADVNYVARVSSSEHSGFSWRSGRERNTTGIWVWSHPFVVSEGVWNVCV